MRNEGLQDIKALNLLHIELSNRHWDLYSNLKPQSGRDCDSLSALVKLAEKNIIECGDGVTALRRGNYGDVELAISYVLGKLSDTE